MRLTKSNKIIRRFQKVLPRPLDGPFCIQGPVNDCDIGVYKREMQDRSRSMNRNKCIDVAALVSVCQDGIRSCH